MQRHLGAQAASQGYLFEALSGIATLKASGAEDRALDRWSDLFAAELNIALQRSHLSALLESARAALALLSPLLLLWVGVQRVLDGTLSLGAMLALTALAGAVLASLTSLMANAERLQLAGAHLERLDDVLDAEPEQDRSSVAAAPPLSGRIELRGVGFRYDPAAPWVLRDLSLTIEPGQKVALVGATGSGKSTLGRLLLGLFEPAEGELLYDGIPLRQMDYRTLRRQFGVVLQEPVLFGDSIRRNIALNDPALTLTDVIEAARTAAIDDDIERMPMGYETLIGEGGGGLSGGQVQRIALARALGHRPSVLLLDEATSHLDVVTERRVDRNLSSLACTRIVIAHRLSTIRNADLIVVVDRGTIVERGRHDDLLALDGAYAALVRSQTATDPAEEPPPPINGRANSWCHYCPRCGAQARHGHRFCVGCGVTLGRCVGRRAPHYLRASEHRITMSDVQLSS
jgi:ABC-type bacteriocin/lantibiotic exporter with double-glycine peptidase domain